MADKRHSAGTAPRTELSPNSRWDLVSSLQHALKNVDDGLAAVPGLVREVILSEAWRDFPSPVGAPAKHETFTDFVTTPKPRGLSTTLDQVERLLAGNPDALEAFRRETNPSGSPVGPPLEVQTRGRLVSTLAAAVKRTTDGLDSIPGLTKRVLETDAWREFSSPLRAEPITHTQFRDFVTERGPRGLGISPDLAERLIAHDWGALEAFRMEIRKRTEPDPIEDGVNAVANWLVVQSLGGALADTGHGLSVVPGLLKRCLNEGSWRKFRTPFGVVMEYERFEDFVTTPPTRGLGASLDLIERIIADDPEAMALFAEATGRHPRGEGRVCEETRKLQNLQLAPDRVDYGPYQVHPLLACFPLLGSIEFDALVASIADVGLAHSIQLSADLGTIIDGRSRYLACIAARVDPHFEPIPETWSDETVVKYILAENLYRRGSLPAEQEAALWTVAALLAEGTRFEQTIRARYDLARGIN